MHIVFVTTEFVTENIYCGGLSNFTANMARIFSEHGHSITVLVAAGIDKSKMWNRIHVECINYWQNPVSNLFSLKDRKNWMVFIQKCIGSYIIKEKIKEINQKQKIDVIHYCNLEGVALFTNNIPYVVRLSCYNNIWKGAYKQHFLPNYKDNPRDGADLAEEFAIRHAKVVVSPSCCLADITERNLKKRALVIESPYYFDQSEWDDSIYKNLQNKRYVLFFGTLGYMKGAHVLAEIVYDFLDKYPDMHLVMVGKEKNIYDGIKETPAHKVILNNAGKYQNRIIYYREMDKKFLYPIIKKADFCILPSRIDNLPNTCIEAMSLKKIVIGTDGASFEQLIKNGVNGYLADRDNPESYMTAIDAVMSLSPEEKCQVEQKAYERIEKLNPERIYKQYCSLYQRVISNWK